MSHSFRMKYPYDVTFSRQRAFVRKFAALCDFVVFNIRVMIRGIAETKLLAGK